MTERLIVSLIMENANGKLIFNLSNLIIVLFDITGDFYDIQL